MCRRCGEPDRRGSAASRRRSRARLLDDNGNGVICPCTWCGTLLGQTAGLLIVGRAALAIARLERDRLMPGGSYAYWNLVPSCGPCNRRRSYLDQHFDEGCAFGSGRRRAAAQIDAAA